MSWSSPKTARPSTRADDLVPRPADWADWASFRLELGVDVQWAGAGATWGLARWDVDRWVGLYEPGEWRDVTAYVQSFDFDSGRQSLLDPGDVGTATATLVDWDGSLGLTGRGSPVGTLLRAWAGLAGGAGRLVFWGKIAESSYVGDLAGPAITLRALDPLGVALEGEVLQVLPAAASVTDALAYLLDRTLWPLYYRDLEADPTAVLAVPAPGRAMDEARRAVESVAGVIWTQGPVIGYRARTVALDPGTVPALHISTEAGAPGGAMPSALGWHEGLGDVSNMVQLETLEGAEAHAADPSSVAHYGPRLYAKRDLITTAGDLETIARRVLGLRAWPPVRIEPLQLEVHDAETARATLVALGDVVEVTYTGSAPVAHVRQVVGALAHHVSPEEWTVTLRTFVPEREPYDPEPTSLHWTVPPGDGPPGASFDPNLEVWVLDQRGQLAHTETPRVQLFVTAGGGFLAGNSDINAMGGIGRFGTLALVGSTPGPGHVLTVLATWADRPDLVLLAESPPFTVSATEATDA